ncbi:LCP family protein [Bacillus licheniformis]|nr:LCP family protein [Bacillus licheniformis]
MISIMRDSYVDIPGYDKQKSMRLMHTEARNSSENIKESFDLDINYYAVIDLKVCQIVDAVAPDGIEVDVPKNVIRNRHDTAAGKQVLHGERLLGYVRFRHDRESDLDGSEGSRKSFQSFKRSGEHRKYRTASEAVGLVDPYIETNIPNGVILSVGKDFCLEA